MTVFLFVLVVISFTIGAERLCSIIDRNRQ